MSDPRELLQRIRESNYEDEDAINELRKLSGGDLPRPAETQIDAASRRKGGAPSLSREPESPSQGDDLSLVDIPNIEPRLSFEGRTGPNKSKVNFEQPPITKRKPVMQELMARHLAATEAFIRGDNEPSETSQRILEELERDGSSEEISKSVAEVDRVDQEQALETAREIATDPSVPVDRKIHSLESVIQGAKTGQEVETKLTDYLRRAVLQKLEASGGQDRVANQNVLESMREHIWYTQEWAEILAGLEGLNEGAWGQVRDITQIGLMPGFAQQYRKVHEAAFPGTSNLLHTGLGGEMIKMTNDMLNELPVKERLEKLQVMLGAINQNEFWGIENDVMKFFLIQEIFPDPLITDGELETERVLVNVFSVLDALAFISPIVTVSRTAQKLFKGAKQARATRRQIRSISDRFQVSPEMAQTMVNDKMTNILLRLDNLEGDYPRNHPLSVMESVAPSQASKEIEKILDDDTRELAEELNIDYDILLNQHVLPKSAVREEISGHVSLPLGRSLTDRKNELEIAAAQLEYNPVSAGHFAAEVKSAQNMHMLRIKEMTEDMNLSHLNKSQISPLQDGSGWYISHIVGRDANRGWNTVEDARKAAQRYDEVTVQGMPYQVLARHPRKGTYVSLDEFKAYEKDVMKNAPKGLRVTSIKTDYILKMDYKHLYDSADALAQSQLKGDTFIRADGLTGIWARFTHKAGYLTSTIMRAGTTAVDIAQSHLQAYRRILRPVTDLNAEQQHQLSKLLQEDNGKHPWRNMAQLKRRWGHRKDFDKLVLAYDSARIIAKQMYRTQDKNVASKLRSEGNRVIKFARGLPPGLSADNRLIGKPIQGVPRTFTGDVPRKVWDPETGQMVAMTPEMAKKIVDDGGQFLKFNYPMRLLRGSGIYDDVNFTFKRIDSDAIELNRIPERGVLRELDSYVPQVHEAPWVVGKVIRTQVDGGPMTEKFIPLYSASNKGEAELLIKDGTSPDSKLEMRSGRDSTVARAFANEQSLETFDATGRLFTSPRSERGLPGINGRTNLINPIEALEIGIQKAARDEILLPIINKLVANWEKSFGKKFGVVDRNGQPGKMPMAQRGWLGGDNTLARPTNPDDLAEWKDAVAFRDHIMQLLGGSEPAFRKMWNERVDMFSDYLTTSFRNDTMWQLSDGFRRTFKDADPVGISKALAFVRWIVFNPLRQLLLQFNQNSLYLGLDGFGEYAKSGKLFLEYNGLAIGINSRRTKAWDKILDMVPQKMGMTKEEYTDYIDSYIKTGLPIVDSHTYANIMSLPSEIIQGSDAPSALQQSKFWANRNLKSSLRFVRKIGFDTGEQAHLLTSFNLARNRWMKQNPEKAHLWSTEGLQDIAMQARTWALDMNQAGAMDFQKGTLGLMFQFMSHMTKSLQMVLPSEKIGLPGIGQVKLPKGYKNTVGKLSNKQVSDLEKDRIRTTQFMLYGAGGFGLVQAYQSAISDMGIDPPEEVNMGVEEGLVGTALNLWIRSGDEDTQQNIDFEQETASSRVRFSEQYGPFAGTWGGMPVIGGEATNPLAKVVNSVLLSNERLYEIVGHAALPVYSDIGKALKFTGTIMGFNTKFNRLEDLDITEPHRVALLVDEWARLMPVYNNFAKMRAGMQANAVISNSNNEVVRATFRELLAKGLLGTPLAREEDTRSLLMELTGVRALEEDPITSDLDDIANTYYDTILTVLRRTGGDSLVHGGVIDEEKALDMVENNTSYLKFILNEDEYHYVINKFRDAVYSDVNDRFEPRLVEEIMRLYASGGAPEGFLDRVRVMADFDGKKELIELVEDVMEEYNQETSYEHLGPEYNLGTE